MARKTPSRLELRKQAEIADKKSAKGGSASGTTKKKRAKRKKATRRTKAKTPQRRILLWGVFNGSMKEEARFPYDQREAAEEKLEQLRAKATKKLYFIQPIKEALDEAAELAAATAKAEAEAQEDETEEVEAEVDDDSDADESADDDDSDDDDSDDDDDDD